jgi:hypothetical protein
MPDWEMGEDQSIMTNQQAVNIDQTLDRLRDLMTPGAIAGRCLNCVAIMRLTLDAIAKNPKTAALPEFTKEQVEAEKSALLAVYPEAANCPNCAVGSTA